MNRTKSALAAAALVASALTASGVRAEPWSRGYVVEWIEAASHFGGKGQQTEPGSDCPLGTETIDLHKLLLTCLQPICSDLGVIESGGIPSDRDTNSSRAIETNGRPASRVRDMQVFFILLILGSEHSLTHPGPQALLSFVLIILLL